MYRGIIAAFIAVLGQAGAAAAAESCALPSLADSAALEPLAGSDLMTVPVEVNGKPKKFLLAIGSDPSEISEATVAELALPENGKATTALQFGPADPMAATGAGMSVAVVDARHETGRNAARARVGIDSFRIGDATARHMQFLISDDKEMGKSKPYDGLVRGEFFKQYDVELDFHGRQINFLTTTRCTDPDKVVFWSHAAVAAIPMSVLDGKIHTRVSIEGHEIDAVIDTGSARTVMRRDIAELTLGYKAGTADMMPAADLKDSTGQPVYGHSFAQISFAGGVAASNVPALIQTASMTQDPRADPTLGSRAQSGAARIPDLTLGMDVLHQLHLYIVYGQKKIYATASN